MYLERMQSMNSNYELSYHKAALKFLAKQEQSVQERISEGVSGLLKIPPEGDIRLMKGYRELYRLRVGTFRVLFEVDHNERIIYIQAIGNRGDVYK